MRLSIFKNIKKRLIEIGQKTFSINIYVRYKMKVLPYESVIMELTNECNLTCSYCPKAYGIGLGKDMMSLENLKLVFNRVNKDINLKEKSLTKIIESKKMKNLKKRNMYTCLADLPICDSCDAWKNVPNIYLKLGKRWY